MSRLNLLLELVNHKHGELVPVVRTASLHVVYTSLDRFVYIQHFEGYTLRRVLSKEDLVQIEEMVQKVAGFSEIA